MKLYIVNGFIEYTTSDERYCRSELAPTLEAAKTMVNQMIDEDLRENMAGSEDNTEEKTREIVKLCTDEAWKEGSENLSHDAILYYGDMTVFYDITETSIDLT